MTYLEGLVILLLSSSPVYGNDTITTAFDLTEHWIGYASLGLFFLTYILVTLEDRIQLKKSKPTMLAAGVIWVLIAWYYYLADAGHFIEPAVNGYFLEYAQLFFFLLVSMTYINSMMERGVFDALRHWLLARHYHYKTMFWITGGLAFVISPIADNLTTALIMCAVIMAIADGQQRFVTLCCVNIVVAANAGGAFSPFGDITTLMVWQKGMVPFGDFFALFIPSLVNFLVPACIMHFALPKGRPEALARETQSIDKGGLGVVLLFLMTIATAVSFHSFLHIPPVFGMLTGLGYLKLYGYYLQRQSHNWSHGFENPPGSDHAPDDFDVFAKIAHAEWDTLFFFYGIIMAVGGLSFIGYLALVSDWMYGGYSLTTANVMMGLMSAVVDNIPVMFAVLTMQPDMALNQWLLVTLTTGVGGSLLSIGSAAGVALMGQARGYYTFVSHLKWSPVIGLGYAASILVHMAIN